jgi:uncharacterized protein YkwD
MATETVVRRVRLTLLAVTLTALALSSAHAQDTARVLDLVNQHRAAAGLSPLIRAAELDSAARRHSDDMATHNFMSHTGSDGSTPGQRISAAGYQWSTYGENIAAGYSTAEAVVNAWMNSSGHRANILNSRYKEIGLAVTYRAGTTYRYYWTQDFGLRGGSGGGGGGGGGGGTTPPSTTPQLTALSPSSGPTGTTVTLDGQNFGATQGGSRVYFRRTNALVYGSVTIVSWSNSQITARLSGSQKGSYYVWVRRADGRSTSARVFTLQ